MAATLACTPWSSSPRASPYKQLKRVSDWQLTEEAQRQALAELVQAISRLDAAAHWGEGRTSASDGQRFAMPRKVLQQTFSTRFSDYALEFYSFIADNYAPFYSTPIECTDRDAAFVPVLRGIPDRRHTHEQNVRGAYSAVWAMP